MYRKVENGGKVNPIAINIERVEDIEEFYKDLVENYGIDESYLLRIHSALTNDDLQLQEMTVDQYYGRIKHTPFIIMTHARLGDPRFEREYYEYETPSGDKVPRALLWDEEIQPAITSAIKVKDLLGDIDKFLPKIDDELTSSGTAKEKAKVLNSIKRLFTYIRPELRKHKESEGHIIVAKEHLSGVRAFDINWLTIDGDVVPDSTKVFLLTLLEDKEKYCEIVKDTLGGTYLLSFRRVLSDSIINLTVLDASVPLRPLAQIDKSFEVADISVKIDYSDVTIQIDEFASGRYNITRAYGKDSPYQTNPYQSVIGERLEDSKEQSLVICHKDIEVEILKEFRSQNVSVAHYGAVNGRNEWSEYHRCVLVGQFREPVPSYRCKVAARLNDETFSHPDLDSLTIRVANTDFIHHAYQGANRVRCRRTVGSDKDKTSLVAKAEKAEIFMFDSNPEIVKEYLQKQMPTANYRINNKRSKGLSSAFKDALKERGDDGTRKGRYDEDIQKLLIPKIQPGKMYSKSDLKSLLVGVPEADKIVRAFTTHLKKYPSIEQTGSRRGTKYCVLSVSLP